MVSNAYSVSFLQFPHPLSHITYFSTKHGRLVHLDNYLSTLYALSKQEKHGFPQFPAVLGHEYLHELCTSSIVLGASLEHGENTGDSELYDAGIQELGEVLESEIISAPTGAGDRQSSKRKQRTD